MLTDDSGDICLFEYLRSCGLEALCGGLSSSSHAGRRDDGLHLRTITGLTAEQITLLGGYDSSGARTSLDAYLSAAQRQAEVADVRNAYAYDDLGRLTQATQWSPRAESGTVAGLPGHALEVSFGYDAQSRLTSITRREADAADPTAATAWSDPLATSYRFDALGRLVQLSHAANATALENYAWTYDARNRLTAFSSLAEGMTTYGYDERGQLTTVDRTGTANDEAYEYDANGNRITSAAAVGTGAYTTGLHNRLLSDGTYDYRYDDEGNRIKRTTIATGAVTEYSWDHRNRLTAVVEKNIAGDIVLRAEYAYGAGDHRSAKTVTAYAAGVGTVVVDERYLFDGDRMLAVIAPGGDSITTYFAVGGMVYGQTRAGHASEWLFADQLGSTRQVVATDGTLVASYRYDAYGNLTVLAGASAASRFLYTGLEYDAETGNHYAWHRYYDSATGRWLSEDWIEDNLNNNYGYVANGPTNGIDPTGLYVRYHDGSGDDGFFGTEISQRPGSMKFHGLDAAEAADMHRRANQILDLEQTRNHYSDLQTRLRTDAGLLDFFGPSFQEVLQRKEQADAALRVARREFSALGYDNIIVEGSNNTVEPGCQHYGISLGLDGFRGAR